MLCLPGVRRISIWEGMASHHAPSGSKFSNRQVVRRINCIVTGPYRLSYDAGGWVRGRHDGKPVVPGIVAAQELGQASRSERRQICAAFFLPRYSPPASALRCRPRCRRRSTRRSQHAADRKERRDPDATYCRPPPPQPNSRLPGPWSRLTYTSTSLRLSAMKWQCPFFRSRPTRYTSTAWCQRHREPACRA